MRGNPASLKLKGQYMADKTKAPEKAPSLIDVIETTKLGCKAYLEDAAETLKRGPGSQKAMKLAVFRFIGDTLKISGEQRQQAWKQFAATPSWFCTNSSAAAQALKFRTEVEELSEEFDA